jgi:hypothetical protein
MKDNRFKRFAITSARHGPACFRRPHGCSRHVGHGGTDSNAPTGLLPGHHTLLTHHNHWDALAAGTLGPLDVFLNGTQMVDNLQPTVRATNNAAAPIAYLEFEVTSTNDVTTIIFAAETNTAGSVTIKDPMINGLEIDTPNSTRIANTPSPADGD